VFFCDYPILFLNCIGDLFSIFFLLNFFLKIKSIFVDPLESPFLIPRAIISWSSVENLLNQFLFLRKDVVRQQDVHGRVARVDPLDVKAGNVLDGESALRRKDSGHEEVLDRDQRTRQRHL
jgi:hypothetical protein